MSQLGVTAWKADRYRVQGNTFAAKVHLTQSCSIEATWCPFRNITQCIKSNKKCKLPTIAETCYDENPEMKYEIKNEKNDGNEKCHENPKKGHEIDEINHHCTQFHSFEKKWWAASKEVCVEEMQWLWGGEV